jgi:VWFA-related protein
LPKHIFGDLKHHTYSFEELDMYSFRQNLLFFAVALFVVSNAISAQTPTPTSTPDDKPVVVYTEEIKLNIAAFDLNGNFADALKKEDLVISEDGRLHQANIIQHIPAKVLILLDTGGESRIAKDFKTTRETAKKLVNSLQKDDQVALMQYHDKIELISDWTSDKALLNQILDKKMNFGTRSRFSDALNQAASFLQKVPTENRHLVLISDGLDSTANQEQKTAALRTLTATNINVHVFSYTGLEQQVVEQRKKSISGGGRKAIELPPGADVPIPGKVQTVPIATINTDRAMVKKNKERGDALKRSEQDLTRLTEDTNGIFYLPKTAEEMIDKTAELAKNIDSQYVVTYTPKRPLSESQNGEVRNIEVTSKRDNVVIIARRKLLVVRNEKL